MSGTAEMPRLAVFRSNRFMYAQLINDEAAKTLVSASSIELKGKKSDAAFEVGKELAKKALAAKISTVVFDRGGFGYKGRVKRLADGAREGGLKF
jgi:large subunit ribosomal protein L18